MSGPVLKKRRVTRRIVPTLISSTLPDSAAAEARVREFKPRKAIEICNKFIWLMLGDFLPSAGYKDYLEVGYDEESQSSLRAQAFDAVGKEYGVSCADAGGSKGAAEGKREWSKAWRDILKHVFPCSGSLELNPPLGMDAKAKESTGRAFRCVGADWDESAGYMKLQPDALWKSKKGYADKVLFNRVSMARFVHNNLPTGHKAIPKAYTWLLEYAKSGTMYATGCTVFYVDAKSKETIERIVGDAVRVAMLDKPASDYAMNPCVLASALFHTFGVSEVLLVEQDENESARKDTNNDRGLNMPKDTGDAILSWLNSSASSVPDEVAQAAVVMMDRLEPRVSQTSGAGDEPVVAEDELIDKAIQSLSCTGQDRLNVGRLKGDMHAADSLKEFFIDLILKRKRKNASSLAGNDGSAGSSAKPHVT